MRLRVIGRPAEVDEAVEALREVFVVHTSSRPRATRAMSRDAEVRVYLSVSMPPGRPPVDPVALRCPWCLLPNVLDHQGEVPDGRAWSCRRCGRVFAMAHGLVIPARRVAVGEMLSTDWMAGPGGWAPAGVREQRWSMQVFRPSDGVTWDGEAPLPRSLG